MHFDFRSVDDLESFVSVPQGVHDCRIAEVREGRARDGSIRWSFRLEVIEGEWAGRTAAWDSLTWSERGVHRVKKVLEALGLDVRGELDIEAQDLVGLRARVQVEPEEREDPLTGRRQVRMRVPYVGYASSEGELPTSEGELRSSAGDPRSNARERRPSTSAHGADGRARRNGGDGRDSSDHDVEAGLGEIAAHEGGEAEPRVDGRRTTGHPARDDTSGPDEDFVF